MSFDNIYPNRKDWRKKFIKGKAASWGCRNHGSCKWCEGNRKFKFVNKVPLEIYE